ncbi:MAG TPA: glycosyltransferase family 9 protein, partial [Caulobacteraceae bacterium]|nr:glycosyltransferase family 9 protein [Caulobacteraceae bacterium]
KALQAKARARGQTLRLIVLPERMGDVVAAEPIARALCRNDGDYLVWVIGRPFADLVRHNPNIDDVLEITCLTEWMALDALTPGTAKTRLNVDGVHCSWFGGPALRNRNPFGIDMDSYFDHGSLLEVFSLLGLGVPLDERPKAWADPTFDAHNWIAEAGLASGFVAFHCGAAADAGRLWPAERFRAVADWVLANTPFSVLELGLEPVLQPTARTRPLGGALPLSRQTAVLAQAKAFLGGDSGFAHLANALALPSVVLLGQYRHFENQMPFSGPWKREDGVAIVRTARPIANIETSTVIEALAKQLG